MFRSASGSHASDVAEPPSASREHPSEPPASVARVDTATAESPRTEKSYTEAAPTETATIDTNTAHAGSPKRSMFHQPRRFIGRLASLPLSHAAPFQVQPTNLNSKRGGGRSRKHRTEGRPDFREMPDYGGDPIEE